VSTATATLTSTQPTTRNAWSLRRTTLVVGLAASAVVAALAALLHAAGVSFDVDGEIPTAAFAQMTFLGAVAGGVIAAVLKRRSVEPARRFVQVAVALTAVSCIPSVAFAQDLATKLALVTTHLVAAAIIVPVLARKLDA
jgi:peptidoglycan/LPS O-acetylase OafA/YrhL